MKVFGVVTLYFPPSEIIENINSYLYGLDGLMIWDNTPEDQGPGQCIPSGGIWKIFVMHRSLQRRNLLPVFSYSRKNFFCG